MANLVSSPKGYYTVSSDLSASAAGTAARSDGFGVNTSNLPYNAPPAAQTVFVANRPCRLMQISGRVDVVGSDASAVTASFYKVPSGTAPGSGTIQHSGTYNFKGTANTVQPLTLSTTESDLQFAAGDALVMVITGVTTAAIGSVAADVAWR